MLERAQLVVLKDLMEIMLLFVSPESVTLAQEMLNQANAARAESEPSPLWQRG